MNLGGGRTICRNRALVEAFALVLLFFSPVTKAATAQSLKPAWEWTAAERLSQRFDAGAMKARAARREAEQRAAAKWFPPASAGPFAAHSAAAEPKTETIDGNQTPELFLPLELFDHLLLMGFPPGGRDQLETRRAVEDRAAPLGFGRDLWQRLHRAAGPYLNLQRERRPKSSSLDAGEGVSQLDAEDLSWCRTRKAAFVAAGKEFGQEDLLRLLYLGVAPGFSLTYVLDDVNEHSRYLHFLEEGCR
jgi:hypothetical protein